MKETLLRQLLGVVKDIIQKEFKTDLETFLLGDKNKEKKKEILASISVRKQLFKLFIEEVNKENEVKKFAESLKQALDRVCEDISIGIIDLRTKSQRYQGKELVDKIGNIFLDFVERKERERTKTAKQNIKATINY